MILTVLIELFCLLPRKPFNWVHNILTESLFNIYLYIVKNVLW